MRKVTLLSMDLANECTTRCVLMARALQRKYEAEIIGPLWRGPGGARQSLSPYFRELGLPITAVEGHDWPRFLLTVRHTLRRIDGDVVIACKARPASYGIALLKRALTGVPVILDVDDDDVAITGMMYKKGRWLNIGHPNGHRPTRFVDGLRHRADAVTCVSGRFCREYGGVIAPHARDPAEYDPDARDGAALRRSLGFSPGDHVIGFIGTPRRMKGIHVLLDALDQLRRPNVKLLIVGASEGVREVQAIRARGDHVVLLPPAPMDQVPDYIAASDSIALPQTNSPLTSGQMPAKLTEAMAMGKPIVASATSDIPRYLDGCGVVVPPEDVDALAQAIAWIVDHPEGARDLGLRARQRFLKDMTADYLFDVLDSCIERVLAGRPARQSASRPPMGTAPRGPADGGPLSGRSL